MSPLMKGKPTCLSEAFSTNSANIGLFPIVQVTMLYASLSAGKGLMTNLAFKGSQAPVAGLYMSLQIRLGVVGFIALCVHAAVDTGHQFGNDSMGHLITMGKPSHIDKNGSA